MNIIFHHPLPLDPNAKSASGIRPQRMLKAFQDLGCKVDLVTGYAKERKAAIRLIKKNIKRGIKYDFVYAESSTTPTTMTETHHLPLYPFLDFNFFRLCNTYNIPIGLFYRDIYWLFKEYGKGLNPIKVWAAKLAYRFDLWVYKRTLTKLYLPSMEMGEYIPYVNSNQFEALPPGHSANIPQQTPQKTGKNLKLFYVGGMSSHYQMHKLFNVLKGFPNIEFTLCTRKSEWEAVMLEYPSPTSNVKIIHESGDIIQHYLRECDITVLFVKPQEYWQFASPVKLYEYIGAQKPILSSAGTLAGRFVKENAVGWTISYDEIELQKHLQWLLKNPEAIEAATQQVKLVTSHHSWQVRAKQVIQGLTP
ncbi:MAG: glycosyltransferase [Flavobacteriales bacterium]|nr:glycosyltransferase [Flavobacteriales bacterium]